MKNARLFVSNKSPSVPFARRSDKKKKRLSASERKPPKKQRRRRKRKRKRMPSPPCPWASVVPLSDNRTERAR